MSTIYPTLPRLSVKESFDDDELTDIDDEVFIRDGKTGGGFKSQDEGVKRPLMAPRKKPKTSFESQKLPLRALLLPICYGIMALVLLLGLIMLCVVTVNIFPVPFTMIKNLFPPKENTGLNSTDEVLPCTSLSSSIVWVRTLPKLTSEAPLRSVDVDGDGVEDIIVGFSTGLDTLDAPEFLCNLYFKGQTPCLGGVKALDGRTGETMWTHWTEHAIFSIDCAFDITDDKTNDCIITGRGGILHAVDGQDGAAIWEVSNKEFPASVMEPEIILNVYDARYMTDIDGDGIVDVIVAHTTQTGTLRSSEIIMLSGKTGTVIKTMDFSKNEQLFIAPQTLVHPDGEVMYLLAASTTEQSGGLYIVSHSNLLYGKMNLKTLQYGKGKGVLLAPILVDITLDGTADIIVSSLDSKVRAYNGHTFELIWNYTVPDSEIISIPIPGYYNDDEVPDIMIKHQVGPGFPVYYYSVSTILDGKTGKPLLEQPIKDSGNGQMSGLSLSVDGPGNDWFLYWSANCVDHNNVDEKYRFLKGQTLLSQSRANLCKLRFNTTLNTRLLAMSQHIGPPGQSLYFSEDWKSVELNNSIDARHETEEYLNNLPSQMEMNNAMENGPMVSQRSAKLRVNTQERIEDERIINNYPNMESNLEGKGPNEINYLVNNNNDDNSNNNNNNNNNEKEIIESYPAYNDLSEYKTKVSNDFPGEMEWSNSNNNDWNNLPMEMRYERNDPNSQQSKRRRKRNNKIADSARRKRNINININNNNNNNNNDNKNYEGIDQSIQRQPPTGLLLPSLIKNPKTTSIDLVFSTYWLPPSEVSLVLLQQDLECIHLKEESARRKLEPYERENIIADCLSNRGVNYKLYREGLDRENVKFALGQMTIYRMKLECVCPEDLLPGQRCNNISKTQSWSAHLGRNGDGYFRPFVKPNT